MSWIQIPATEIKESRDPGAFAAFVRQEIVRRETNEWAKFLYNDGRGVQHVAPWLQLPEGL